VQKIHAQVILGLLALLIALPAVSAVSIPYGYYLGGSVGWAKIYDKNYSGSVSHSGLGAGINVGYKFNPFMAFEFNGTHYADTVIKDVNTTVARDSHYSYSAQGKLMFPLGSSGASVVGKVGVSRLQSNLKISNCGVAAQNGLTCQTVSHYATGLYLAAGGEYSVTPNLLTNIEIARAQGNSHTGDAAILSLGASYIF